ncbi:MAG: hypothetical protein GX868_15765, partial [Actinobacteria bacterium]|nr:hypothetical protein [Actinomycetota bacterium]
MAEPAINADDRPIDNTPITTLDLPMTPVRDRNIPATAWIEAPPELLALADSLPPDAAGRTTFYKRRIGPWLLWRCGPAARANACYWAGHVEDLSRQFTFRLFPNATGRGTGPSGQTHDRFRDW